jgi:type I restriction enzyme M protein
VKTRKTELLFLVLILRMLKVGGRSATIVPDGVLFGSSTAHVALRKLLMDQNQLEAVISLPSGVFKPYAGVSTGILVFTKGGRMDDVFFQCRQALFTDDRSWRDKRAPPSTASALTSCSQDKPRTAPGVALAQLTVASTLGGAG